MLTTLIIVTVLFVGLLCCYLVATIVERVCINPARATLRAFETTRPLEGAVFEVLFTPYEPKIFGPDPARENYCLIINNKGFGLRVSFPASLYSRQKPLFFPWSSVSSVERSFLTNLLVKVKGRENGFFLYAGIVGARKLHDKWLLSRAA